MRALSQLNVPKNEDPNLPFAGIQNETNTQDGTPVVEELYGDVLSNIYKLIQRAGITFTGTQDNDSTQYQLVQALELFHNVLNDVEQTITLNATTWSVGFNIDILPNKYVFNGRVSHDYNASETYTFEGTGSNSYSLTSPTGFNASDEVHVVIDTTEVRVYSITSLLKQPQYFPVLSDVLKYNSSLDLYYNQNGSLLKDDFTIDSLISTIRVAAGNNDLDMIEMFVSQGHVLCVTYDTVSPEYVFYQFSLSSLNTAELVTVSGYSIPTGGSIVSNPVFYSNGDSLYLTNQSGSDANDSIISKFNYDASAASLDFVSHTTLSDYIKTNNGVVLGDNLTTFTGGQLNRYSLNTGSRTQNLLFDSFLGKLFIIGSVIYININGIAKKVSEV